MPKRSQVGPAVLFAIVVLGALALYQIRASYYAKVSVTEAVRFAEQLAVAVDKFRIEHQRFPGSLGVLTLPTGEAGYIPSVTIEPSTGVLTISVESAHGQFGTLRFIPAEVPSTTQSLSWRCKNDSVAQDILPAQCR